MAYTTYKDLTKKQKVEHIWEYYRWHIIGTIVGTILVVSLLTTMFGPRPPANAVDLVVSGRMALDSDTLDAFNESFYEGFEAGVTTIACDWSATDMVSATNEQLLALKFQVQECDILAISPIRHEGYMNIEDFEALAPLDEIPELSDILVKYADSLITKVNTEGEEHVYGVQVPMLNHIEGIVLGEEVVVSLLSYTKDQEKAIQVMKYILE